MRRERVVEDVIRTGKGCGKEGRRTSFFIRRAVICRVSSASRTAYTPVITSDPVGHPRQNEDKTVMLLLVNGWSGDPEKIGVQTTH
jgi:hypothetical protein